MFSSIQGHSRRPGTFIIEHQVLGRCLELLVVKRWSLLYVSLGTEHRRTGCGVAYLDIRGLPCTEYDYEENNRADDITSRYR